MRLAALMLCLGMAACSSSGDEPYSSGNIPDGGWMHVHIVQGPPADPAFVPPNTCVIQTDLPTEHKGGDLPQFEQLGRDAYSCIMGTAPVEEHVPDNAWYADMHAFFIESGECYQAEDWTSYGCYKGTFGDIHTEVESIGPDRLCPHGTPFPDGYTEQCWTQFDKVLGHEIAHGLYGSYHG